MVIALLGRFKGETGEKCHLIPLPFMINSGIQVGKWLEMLVSIQASEGRYCGPAFCDERGNVAQSSEYDATFIEVLERLQARQPEIFLPGENLLETHGISHLLRKGSNLEVQAAGIPQPEVERMNRWRKVERAAGRQPRFHMIEHYMSVKIALKSLLHYPTAL